MVEEFKTALEIYGYAKGFFQLGSALKNIINSDVISAHFDWKCVRIHGSENIIVTIHSDSSDETVWWYEVEELEGYTFIRMPVIESCAYELIGQKEGESNPDARFWRWVAPVRPGVIVGGKNEAPLLNVEFIVVGYKPKALIDHFQSQA